MKNIIFTNVIFIDASLIYISDLVFKPYTMVIMFYILNMARNGFKANVIEIFITIFLIYQIVDSVELLVNYAIIVTIRVVLYSDSSI